MHAAQLTAAPRIEPRPAPTRAARLVAGAAAAALAVGLALAGVAAPAAAETPDGPEVTWGVRTADTAWGDGRESYAYRIDAGQTIEDALVIANHDVVPVELDVYAADAFTTDSGQLDVATRDARPRELGAWTLAAVDRVTVQPGEAVEVPFTITVPANATPGDHAGGILTSLVDPEVDQGLTVDRRLGIRIHLRVGGELAPALAVDDLRVDYAGTLNPFGTGEATVTYTVRNAGNARLSATQAVALAGPFGLLPVAAGAVDDVPELLPGETWPVTVQVAGIVPAFVLTATVSLDPEPPTETKPDPVAVEESAMTAAVPWTLLALLLLVAGAIVLRVRLGRRRRAQRQAREDARVQEAVDRALRQHGAADASSAQAEGEGALDRADSSDGADSSNGADRPPSSDAPEPAPSSVP